MTNGRCLLCEEESKLRLSHVVPAFVYRWLRESSGNGHLRMSLEPNRRVQDGPKHYWLCSKCEELFSGSETAFAGKLFHPYLEGSGKIFPYSIWLSHFCASVSWRVLRHYMQEQPLSEWKDWTPEEQAHVTNAEQTWREFLLGKRHNPGRYQQHMLPLDQIASFRGSFSPNINRYLMRAVHMDVCRGPSSCFTYTKLGRFMILGFIYEANPTRWKGTKVHANHGLIEPRKYEVPGALGHYINEKAAKVRDALGSVSDRQQAKIEEAFRSNVGRFIGSDAFAAMQADIDLFGDEALSGPKGAEAP